MKTLYSRIVLTTILILLFSSFSAFILTNLYYQYNLKEFNDEKITSMAYDIERFYSRNPDVATGDYLDFIGQLGYQLYLTNSPGKGAFHGGEFRNAEIEPDIVRKVIEGETYHGIRSFPTGVLVTGFFDNDLKNSIGVPIEIGGVPHALFLRPDVTVQFGEMRIFFSIILVIAILLCILLVGIVTRHIVRPIVKLTEATKSISEGTYDVRLDVKRKDEIGQLAHHFLHMAKGLEQLEQMRQEFVSNVSHEIQSPLASIQGFSQTLQAGNLSPEQQQRYLSIIEEESRRLSSLSKQLLVLASLEKEERVLDKTTFDLSAQIRQVLSVTEWSWRSKELAMDLELPTMMVHGDQQLLHQVWTNLLTNSIKFTDEGGTISVSLSRQNHSLCVTISDTGIGIAEGDLPHIFNRFYKADTARDRKTNSTGLGLSISKKIIDLHDGRIEAESREGEGTTFRVYLPAV